MDSRLRGNDEEGAGMTGVYFVVPAPPSSPRRRGPTNNEHKKRLPKEPFFGVAPVQLLQHQPNLVGSVGSVVGAIAVNGGSHVDQSTVFAANHTQSFTAWEGTVDDDA